ncbi:hypothetical protein KSP35_13015 [Aquihabitans sp. G128]|uniref:hypothetical protein n=1 Tax=Aquihabitans sp. G128 TaxID=2849779 RepID=UPI001C23E9C6|nr:hypothetical protein [Aquihabitans sp. G128]QXC59323.1 hypothetical protein KSP35_13015 [Aquihabitans sp. G128]
MSGRDPTKRWSEREFGLTKGFIGPVGPQIRAVDAKVPPRQRPPDDTATPYIPPDPYVTTFGGELSGEDPALLALPFAGTWDVWGDIRVTYEGVKGARVESNITFDQTSWPLQGSSVFESWPSFNYDPVTNPDELSGTKYFTVGLVRTFLVVTDADPLTFEVSLQCRDRDGAAIPLNTSGYQIYAVCLTGNPTP